MNKIWALTLNEWTKISRKTSILVIVILMVIGITGLGMIMRFAIEDNAYEPGQRDNEWVQRAMQDYINDLNQQLADIERELMDSDEVSRPALLETKKYLDDEIEVFTLAIEQNINLMTGQSYLEEVLRQRQRWRAEQIDLRQSAEPDEDRLAVVDERISRYDRILSERDFNEYIQLRNEEIRTDSSLSEREKERMISINDLWLELDPDGRDAEGLTSSGIRFALNQVEALQRSLNENLDYAGSYYEGALPMSPERRGEVENELAVLMYKLENGLPASSQSMTTKDMAVNSMTGVGLFMAILLMSILAGSAISSEISTGSIKSLIISPVRRWKIYTAKLIALATTGAVIGLFMYIVTMVVHGLLFGFASGTPYIYAVNGSANEIGFYLYQLARLSVQFIDVAVYTMMAYMLSIVTRNTAVSVGLSIAVYFSSSIIRAFMTLFQGKEWVKFIPFSNMSLADRIFPFDAMNQSGGFLFGMVNPSVNTTTTFSLVYIGVLLICMGYIGLDSFTRRDIK